jgi:hypothetical protein
VQYLAWGATIHTGTFNLLHSHLGLTKEQAKDTCKEVHHQSVLSLSSIYRSKLHLNKPMLITAS